MEELRFEHSLSSNIFLQSMLNLYFSHLIGEFCLSFYVMADRKKVLQINAEGEFFVDSTCISCDLCRQIAPEVFADSGRYSYVRSQPRDKIERRKAIRAMICCPVGAIGMRSKKFKSDIMKVIDEFPLLIEDDVFYSGFNSEKSFGANSYFVRSPSANFLVDSPRFTIHLIRKFELMGGIDYIFLTHRDDVADAEKFASHFKAKVVIHKRDGIAVKTQI